MGKALLNHSPLRCGPAVTGAADEEAWRHAEDVGEDRGTEWSIKGRCLPGTESAGGRLAGVAVSLGAGRLFWRRERKPRPRLPLGPPPSTPAWLLGAASCSLLVPRRPQLCFSLLTHRAFQEHHLVTSGALLWTDTSVEKCHGRLGLFLFLFPKGMGPSPCLWLFTHSSLHWEILPGGSHSFTNT